MFIAVVHYHIRQGGVTRVIENAVQAIAGKDVRVVVLVGDPPPPDCKFADRVRVVDGLGYADSATPCSPERLVERMRESAREGLQAEPDVWHFHNHSLGKNCALTKAVGLLAKHGKKILLQIHDFAEDERPQLFQSMLQEIGTGRPAEFGRLVYPQASHIHYAVINRRDKTLLHDAGVPPPRLHLLSNPVTLKEIPDDGSAKDRTGAGRLFLYPTRAIRRKNIGEFILWAALAEPKDRYAITMAPNNPLERSFYDGWVKVAKSLRLPVEFEVGRSRRQSFPALLQSAWAAVTTSIAEGFGLDFLEPWIVYRPILGRNIPDITSEFETSGIDLSSLYRSLLVPMAWIRQDVFVEKIRAGLERVSRTYGRKVKPENVDRALAAAMEDDHVDFARLDESLQQEVIRKAAGSRSLQKTLRPSCLAEDVLPDRILAHNQAIVKQVFSVESYRDRLMAIYQGLMAAETEPDIGGIDVNRLLDQFLAPERFYLLRS